MNPDRTKKKLTPMPPLMNCDSSGGRASRSAKCPSKTAMAAANRALVNSVNWGLFMAMGMAQASGVALGGQARLKSVPIKVRLGL